MDVRQMNSLTLAYLGDANYELRVRKHLISQKIIKPKQLQREAIKFVSANAQAAFVHALFDQEFLTEEEVDVLIRGRNAKSRVPKNVEVTTYRYATGLESLFGYHCYQENEERLDEIFNQIILLKEEL
jgi:ribonuclease-3 family protein